MQLSTAAPEYPIRERKYKHHNVVLSYLATVKASVTGSVHCIKASCARRSAAATKEQFRRYWKLKTAKYSTVTRLKASSCIGGRCPHKPRALSCASQNQKQVSYLESAASFGGGHDGQSALPNTMVRGRYNFRGQAKLTLERASTARTAPALLTSHKKFPA